MLAAICCLVVFQVDDQPVPLPPQATSLLGESLRPAAPSEKLLQRFREHEAAYHADPNNVDKLIWYGRFLAYKGDYNAAISIYTKGIEQFPKDARMYRHRAHRYITIRKFAKAVADLNRAAELIKGKPNEIEPDGMPNTKNTPISTLHGNIFYHLGLAYYLQGNFPKALAAYRKCLRLKTNDDNTVSATHWLYMILRRLGRDDDAKRVFRNVRREMNIIENFSYHQACLFYKGELSLAELKEGKSDSPADDAVRYAVANWYFCNGDWSKATASLKSLVDGKTWQSFGHIAAEADFAWLKSKQEAMRTRPSLRITTVPRGRLGVFRNAFEKYVDVFGVHIFATRQTPDAKLRHIAGVLAQYLDNDEDGKPDNPAVVKALVFRDAHMVIAASEPEIETIDPDDWFEAGFHAGQSQWATETAPGGGAFDATLEEVFHLITHHGYANAYPKVFGTEPGTEIAKCLDAARGGRFEDVPRRYPKDAWFTYDDETCEYECQITEYIYWAMTSILGAQRAPRRQREISHEWKLPTRELVERRDPAVFKLLTNRQFAFPTTLPDGHYGKARIDARK